MDEHAEQASDRRNHTADGSGKDVDARLAVTERAGKCGACMLLMEETVSLQLLMLMLLLWLLQVRGWYSRLAWE